MWLVLSALLVYGVMVLAQGVQGDDSRWWEVVLGVLLLSCFVEILLLVIKRRDHGGGEK